MRAAIRAVVFRGAGRWGLETRPAPRVEAPDEVLLRVERAGICGTDLHILAVPPGHPAAPGSILGHEYVATVLEVGSGVEDLAPGDRVVVDPNLTCGTCASCRLGLSNVCERMTTLGIFRHGGLAELNVAPARALHRIAPEVPLDRAVFAEPLACVLHGLERAGLGPGERVAILGAGPIGLLFLLLGRAAGAGPTVVVEPAALRRQRAAELGADRAVDPAGAADAVRAATGGGADLVVDAVGTCLPEALDLVRRGGRVLLFGVNQQAARPVNQYRITRHEVTVLGSFIQRTAFPKVVRLLEGGRLPVERLITHRLPLAEVGRGFEALRAGEAIKVVVEPSC